MRRWVTNMSVKLFSPGNIVPEKPGIAVNYGYVFFYPKDPAVPGKHRVQSLLPNRAKGLLSQITVLGGKDKICEKGLFFLPFLMYDDGQKHFTREDNR